MARPRNALLALLLLAAAVSFAQTSPRVPPPPGWVPQSVQQLAQHATLHTNFTFDRSMLRLAGNFIDNNDEDTRRAIDKLDTLSIYSFHYSQRGLYNPAELARIRADYEATGWKHVVTAHPHPGGDPFNSEANSGETDLWVSLAGSDVTGMVVLLASAKDIEVISVTGDISPLDLLHLRGHFGIPKFSSDGFPEAKTPPAGEPRSSDQSRPNYVEPAPAQPSNPPQ